MEYSNFKEIIKNGENQYIDFKLHLNIFNKSEKENAEFIKDIIAFSNNGSRKCYIIVGISDDGNTFQSVKNQMLIDQNADDRIQDLIKNCIYPIPKVKLKKQIYRGSNIEKKHSDITFIIIEIGPNPKLCFRFKKDLIDYKNRYCFKRNEVWIRRNSISDLATPEEILNLISQKEKKRHKTINVLNDYEIEFTKDFCNLVSKDLDSLFIKKRIFEEEIHSVTLNVFDQNIELKTFIEPSCKKRESIIGFLLYPYFLNRENVNYFEWFYHGILVISKESITKNSLSHFDPVIKYPEWGWFCYKEDISYYVNQCNIPRFQDRTTNVPLFMFLVHSVKNSQELFDKITLMKNAIIEEKKLKEMVLNTATIKNSIYKKWVEDDCCVPGNKSYLNSIPKLKKDELFSPERYGNSVMKRRPDIKKDLLIFLKNSDS